MNEKVYVQHLIRKHGTQVCEWIYENQAHVFVCGDGANMARDVHAALVDVLVEFAKMTFKDAQSYLTDMMKQSRYVQEIWS